MSSQSEKTAFLVVPLKRNFKVPRKNIAPHPPPTFFPFFKEITKMAIMYI